MWILDDYFTSILQVGIWALRLSKSPEVPEEGGFRAGAEPKVCVHSVPVHMCKAATYGQTPALTSF